VDRERQALPEFIRRTKRGVYLHLPLWLFMGICVGMTASHPRLFWSNCAGFGLTTSLRIALTHWADPLMERHRKAVRYVLRALVFAPCLQWSLLATLSTLPGPLHVLMLPLQFTTVGLATAGTVVLAVDGLVRIWYPIVAMIPVGLAYSLQQPGPMGLLFALMNVTTIGYVSSATRVVHDDYWASLESRTLLEKRAQSLEMSSNTDALTQIPNRRYFEDCLEQAWADAAHDRKPLSVLLVDLDHFKRINDTHGHALGDECLKAAARSLTVGLLRETDLVARWGGEEFVVLLPNTDRDRAQTVAQRLLGCIGSTLVPCPVGIIALACSIGVATRYPDDGVPPPSSLIDEADKALYEAKNQGRNRVVATAA
jgi:diguanylate cyclase (GGDEF)-like protein